MKTYIYIILMALVMCGCVSSNSKISYKPYFLPEEDIRIMNAILDSGFLPNNAMHSKLMDDLAANLRYNVCVFFHPENMYVLASALSERQPGYDLSVYEEMYKPNIIYRYVDLETIKLNNAVFVYPHHYSTTNRYLSRNTDSSLFPGFGVIQFSPAAYNEERNSALILVDLFTYENQGNGFYFKLNKDGEVWRISDSGQLWCAL